MFFGFQKKWGAVLRMPHFSPEMVWYTLSFLTFGSSFHQTLEKVNMSVFTSPPTPPLKGGDIDLLVSDFGCLYVDYIGT